ncbi:MAG: hypothetical protein J0L60_00295 [Ignavibacteria bacterium]|nr:hypothetical protein [Ignavibacteria bacterium]
MNNIKQFIAFVLLIGSVMWGLKAFNVLDITFPFIFSFLFILIGLATVVVVFGKHDIPALLIGTTMFLIGILIYLNQNFYSIPWADLLLPTAMFMIGVNLIVLFLDNPKAPQFLLVSAVFIGFPFFFLSKENSMTVTSMLEAILEMASKYWLIIFLAAISVFFILLQGNFTRKDDEDHLS